MELLLAPYEADAQMTFLNICGIADYVVTEDSDLTLFGCKKVLFDFIIDLHKHAQSTASNVSSSQRDLSSSHDKPKKSPATQSKANTKAEYTITKNNRVIVFENKSGRVLTGNTAPTPDTLKQWLQDNPTFQVVKPGSKQEQFIKEKQEQIIRERQNKQNPISDKSKPNATGQQQKIQTTLKVGPSKNLILVNPSKKALPTTSTPNPSPAARVVTKAQKPPPQASPKQISPVKQASATPKSVTKPATPKTPAPRTSNQNKRKSDPKSDSKPVENKNETSSETIRVTVQRLLKEAISQRMTEVTENKHPKLTCKCNL